MAATPYFVGSNGASSTSILTIAVGTTTSNGDSLKIGVTMNTAGAIPRVTDTQGNAWTNVSTSTTQTGAQLYTFEAPGAAALVAGTDTITVTVTSS